jgi:hypothetical protein
LGSGRPDRCGAGEWWWCDGLGVALGLVGLGVPDGRFVGVADFDPAGENGVGVADGDDPEQAETDAETSMVKVAQLTMVSFAVSPVPMMAVRISTGPLHACGRRRTRFPFPIAEEESRDASGARVAGRKGKGHRRHRHSMA